VGKTLSKLKLGELVEVVWIDAIGENDGWFNPLLFDFKDHETATEVRCVGYFMNQTKENIFVAQLIRSVDHGVARVMSIPVRSIVKIVQK
jgi:hypothetical protein